MIDKTGSAVWHGALKDGSGTISTQSGALSGQPYGFATRFENKPGSNPEELIGAAHAACFSMALANILGKREITPDEIDTTSRVTLDPAQGAVVAVHLDVVIHAPAPEETLVAAAEEAKVNCPISRLLRAEITMSARKG